MAISPIPWLVKVSNHVYGVLEGMEGYDENNGTLRKEGSQLEISLYRLPSDQPQTLINSKADDNEIKPSSHIDVRRHGSVVLLKRGRKKV